MERYRFTSEQQALMERMPVPFAMFQLVDSRIVPLVLSDGFCELLGGDDRDSACAAMERDTFYSVHPDDAARVGEAVYRFIRDGGEFDSIYRLQAREGTGYVVVHALGRHVYMPTGERLAQVWYTNEGEYAWEDARQGTALNQSLSKALHQESILKASDYDTLTGLPTMTYFFELAQAGKEAILREGGEPVLMYMDFSGMKYFNQKNSFAAGNRLLQAFARVLSHTFGNACCCHINADHFMAYAGEAGLEDTLKALFEECRALNGGDSLPLRVGIYPASLRMCRSARPATGQSWPATPWASAMSPALTGTAPTCGTTWKSSSISSPTWIAPSGRAGSRSTISPSSGR